MIRGEWWRASAIGVLLVVCACYVAVRFSGEAPLDTDILHALPLVQGDPVVMDAIGRAEIAAGRLVTLAVRGGDPSLRRSAAQDLTAQLEQTGDFIPHAKEGGEIIRWLSANRHEIVCPDDWQRLAAGGGESIAREALAATTIPGAPITGAMIADDPFLLGLRLSRCLLPAPASADVAATLISGRLTVSGYRGAVQDAIGKVMEDWRRRWIDKGLSLDRSGAIFYAQAAGNTARYEISMIGGIGTISVIILFWVIFRRIHAPLLAAATICAGILVGVATCLAIFDSISVMTCVFGAALVGITVDYAIHYMMTTFTTGESAPQTRLGSIIRPLTTGMVTSVCGFLALVFFTSPVMTEIAVFASAGLVASWAFAVAVLPLLDKRRSRPGRIAAGFARISGLILGCRSRTTSFLGALTLAVVAVAGLARFHVVDDVRAFQKLDPDLQAEGERIRRFTGAQPQVHFLLSRARDEQTAKQIEEAALELLAPSADSQRNGIWLATTRFDPSPKRRQQTRELLRTGLFEPGAPGQARRLGLDPEHVRDQITRQAPAVAYPEALAQLRGVAAGSHYLIVPLTDLQAEQLVERKAALPGGAQVVSITEHYATVLREYRHVSIMALALASAICAIVIIFVYRKWTSLRILVPPILAAAVTTAAQGLFGLPFTFFTGMALLVVLGVGMDFAIFQYERDSSGEQWVLAAICLAAVTSALSMGLLGLSATIPVATFGLSVGLGVMLTMVLSPLARSPVGAHGREP